MFCWTFIFIILVTVKDGIARPDYLRGKINPDYLDEELMHPTPKLSENIRQRWSNDETGTDYWHKQALDALDKHLNKEINENIAKNIIHYMGDGLSVPTLFAARTYQGQLEGKSGEEGELYWESFPYTGLSKTWCIDSQVPDSACTSTAYMTGVKTKLGTIGINGNVIRGDCESQKNKMHHVNSILKLAQDKGKSIGIVTNTRVTHASPAGGYAHVAERHWESDNDIKMMDDNSSECDDIAMQLITQDPGQDFKVILGGGRAKFLPNYTQDEENVPGERLDSKNLIDMWKDDKIKRGSKYLYSWNRTSLMKAMKNPDDYDFILGLFASSHLKYHLEANAEVQPTLSEMTQVAINVLSKNENGFVLFVEGGRIDHAHHDTYATLALDETVELANAVKIGREMTSTEDTLVIVTSDHGHTMSVSGYSERGAKITGFNTQIAIDNLNYMTLSYANGPGYKDPDQSGRRHNISGDNIDDVRYRFPSLVPLKRETHGGEDVAIFSSGPWSHLFTGTIQQSTIPHFLAYASCLAPRSACDDKE